MKPAGMHRQEGPAGQRGSLFKGPDAAGRPAGFIPPGEGWRASPCYVRLVARSTCYASTRLPCLARPAPPARRRWVLLGALIPPEALGAVGAPGLDEAVNGLQVRLGVGDEHDAQPGRIVLSFQVGQVAHL